MDDMDDNAVSQPLSERMRLISAGIQRGLLSLLLGGISDAMVRRWCGRKEFGVHRSLVATIAAASARREQSGCNG